MKMNLQKISMFDEVDLKIKGTINHSRYIDSIRNNTITFCVGPAGCGKTFLAIAEGIRSVISKKDPDRKFKKILCLRPAVTAHEKIGFLPGSLEEKTYHYMRPFISSGEKILGKGNFKKFEKNVFYETFSYLRGETFDDAFVIVDEAQNATIEQMKMILTRLGKRSKMVVVGDNTQSDISQHNGFSDAIMRLEKINGINIIHLTNEDNMRNVLVKKIIEAYDKPLPSALTYFDYNCNNEHIIE